MINKRKGISLNSFICIVLSISLMLGCTSVVAADGTEEKVYLDNNFSDGLVDIEYVNYSNLFENESVTQAEAPESGIDYSYNNDGSLLIKTGKSTAKGETYVYFNLDENYVAGENITVEFKYKSPVLPNQSIQFPRFLRSKTILSNTLISTDGVKLAFRDKDKQISYVLTDMKSEYENKWTHMYMLIEGDYVSFYLNGVQHGDALQLGFTDGAVADRIMIGHISYNTTVGSLFEIDELKIQSYTDLSLEAAGVVPKSNSNKYYFDFNNIIDKSTLDRVTLKNGAVEVDSSLYMISSDPYDVTRLYLTLNDDLPAGEYTVEFFDLMDNPATNPFTGSYSITRDKKSDITFSYESGNLNIKAEFSQPASETELVHLITALYDDNENMIGFKSSPKTLGEDDNPSTSVNYTSEELSGATSVIAFGVDESYQPLRPEYDVYNVANDTSKKEESFLKDDVNVTLDKAKTSIQGRTVSVEGSIDKAQERMLFLMLFDNSANLCSVKPFTTNEDGTFAQDINLLPKADEGLYTAKVTGLRVTSDEDTILCLSEETKQTILAEINGAVDTAAIEKIFTETYKDKIIIDPVYLNYNGFQTVFEQKPYSLYDDAIAIPKEAYDILEKVNASDWIMLGDTIKTTNKDMILHGYEDKDWYLGLVDTEINKINANIAPLLPVDDFVKFRSLISASANQYKASIILRPSVGGNISSGGGGGSSGGGYASRDKYVVEYPAETTTVQQTQQNASQKPDFPDMKGYEWAKEAVNGLREIDVVHGDENGNFRPDAGITRAEFVKMLITVSDMDTENVIADFSDVKKEDWFCSYIATAAKAGIVFGDNKNAFNPNETVTRQDMAVMAFRILNSLGIECTDREAVFADDDKISDYAKEAVYALRSVNIVSGKSDNLFGPTELTIRAQAAQLIYNLAKFIEECDV